MNAPNNNFSWDRISISPKEFIAGLVFVFTMSGVWYKVYYNSETTNKEVHKLERRVDSVEGRVKVMEDLELRRAIREEYNK